MFLIIRRFKLLNEGIIKWLFHKIMTVYNLMPPSLDKVGMLFKYMKGSVVGSIDFDFVIDMLDFMYGDYYYVDLSRFLYYVSYLHKGFQYLLIWCLGEIEIVRIKKYLKRAYISCK